MILNLKTRSVPWEKSIFLLLCLCGLSAAEHVTSEPDKRFVLRDAWYIQPSTEVRESGETLSRADFKPKNWYRASMPSTVLAALVANKVYADPYFGMNLRAIAGTDYPIGSNFSNIPMPPGSPFRCSWWYRTQFTIPGDYQGKKIQLHFDGINFRANVRLNGQQIAN